MGKIFVYFEELFVSTDRVQFVLALKGLSFPVLLKEVTEEDIFWEDKIKVKGGHIYKNGRIKLDEKFYRQNILPQMALYGNGIQEMWEDQISGEKEDLEKEDDQEYSTSAVVQHVKCPSCKFTGTVKVGESLKKCPICNNKALLFSFSLLDKEDEEPVVPEKLAEDPSGLRKFSVGDSSRVETGPIKFGDDFPGLFLRGSSAYRLASHLQVALSKMEDLPEDEELNDVREYLYDVIDSVFDDVVVNGSILDALRRSQNFGSEGLELCKKLEDLFQKRKKVECLQEALRRGR